MNENINLVEILKDCPEGTKLYTPLVGEVHFNCVIEQDNYPIDTYIKEDKADHIYFTKEGLYHDLPNCECILFPSKDQRDWSKFKPKKPKFDPKTLKAFERVLAFDNIDKVWSCDFYSHKANEQECFNPEFPYICVGNTTDRIIPYNDDTKHLVGTSEEAPEYYRYWED